MGSFFCQTRFCKIFSLIRNSRNSSPRGIGMIVIAVTLLCFNLYQLALDQSESELNTACTNGSLSESILCDYFFFVVVVLLVQMFWGFGWQDVNKTSLVLIFAFGSQHRITPNVLPSFIIAFLQSLTYSFNLIPLQFRVSVAFSHSNGSIISEKLTAICFYQFLSQF